VAALLTSAVPLAVAAALAAAPLAAAIPVAAPASAQHAAAALAEGECATSQSGTAGLAKWPDCAGD
jgi:hypothetical protein